MSVKTTKTKTDDKTIFIYLQLILMIIIWSFSFIIVDIAVEIISPLSLALYRFIIGSVSFFIIDIYFWLKKNKNLPKNDVVKDNVNQKNYSRNDCVILLIASFAGVSVFFLAQYNAIQLIGPSLPALYVCLLSPVLISILSLIFFKEKLNSIKIMGFVIATIGTFFLVTGGDITIFTPQSPNFWGYLFALMTPLLWSIYNSAIKHLSKVRKKPALQVLKHVGYLGTLELLIFVIINNEFLIFVEIIITSGIILLCALYLGIGCFVIGYYIWLNSQVKLKSSKGASFLYIEPFITLLFSFLLQRSEMIVLWNIIGGLIVLTAVLIINYR